MENNGEIFTVKSNILEDKISQYITIQDAWYARLKTHPNQCRQSLAMIRLSAKIIVNNIDMLLQNDSVGKFS